MYERVGFPVLRPNPGCGYRKRPYKALIGPAHKQLAVADAFYGCHLIGQGGKQTGLTHDGANVQACALIYVVLL